MFCFRLETPDQVDHLRLDGDIEGGCRLIRRMTRGWHARADGNHYPLTHAARSSGGVISHPASREMVCRLFGAFPHFGRGLRGGPCSDAPGKPRRFARHPENGFREVIGS